MNNHFSGSALGRFRRVALAEGFSYLFLLLVAMPLKYFAGYPDAVKYTGWVHGVLFVLYCIFLLQVWIQYKWTFGKTVIAFAASLLPFGTFVLDKYLRKEMAQ
ncbi:MAG: DUF3817 domain-containing protein [Chitinophagaceae bacterium]